MYQGHAAEQVGAPGDSFESERIARIPLAEIPALIGRGRISSGTTLAALLYANDRQG